MDVDKAIEAKFSHEVKTSSGSAAGQTTADKIVQRQKLLEAYASKELADSQQKGASGLQ